MNRVKKVYFRADGNSRIGLGHVIRSLALADMLSDNFDCHFIIQSPLPTLKNQILEVCNSIICLEEQSDLESEAVEIASDHLDSGDVIVLDGYNFKTEYQRVFKKRDIKVVCIDDIHSYHFVADAIINHAPGIQEKDYNITAQTKLYLGLDYVLIRRTFLEIAQKKRMKNENNHIFICFGGSDSSNLTLKVLKAVLKSSYQIQKICIVLGGANMYKMEIRTFLKSIDKTHVELYSNLTATEMCSVMSKCGIAIIPASTISFEAFACQLKVLCGYVADNQKKYYQYLEENKLVHCAGSFLEISEEALARMIENIAIYDRLMFNPVDGLSKQRLLSLFNTLTK